MHRHTAATPSTFGFGRLFHDNGVTVEPGELSGQCHQLLVGGAGQICAGQGCPIMRLMMA